MRSWTIAAALATGAACSSEGAIPKPGPRPPEHALAGKGDPCSRDQQCADDLVCEESLCINWWRMKGEVPELTPEELARKVDAGEVQILDVRTAPEFRAERIEGAIHVPIGDLAEALPTLQLDRDRPVAAICLTAHRSIAAVRLLSRHGYQVVQLQGGMNAWRRAGLPRVGGSEEKPKRRRQRKKRR